MRLLSRFTVQVVTVVAAMLTGLPAAEAQVNFRPDVLSIPAAALMRKTDTFSYETNGVKMRTPEGGVVTFYAPVELPNFSVITRITLEALDNSADVEFGGFVKVLLREYRFNTVLDLAEVQTDAAGAPGEVRVSNTLTTPHLVRNNEFSYGLDVQMFNGAGGPWSVEYNKVIIEYLWPEFF